ncbi:formate hydrogenlyase transcriptional activator FlhA [Klebsiella pneumoniae]|uniref:formate hydrogenlyase transcriptional activator FlhA n=1 Tax=Klebsiella pneumoniae TaxID=573 RepID=UPI000E2C4661|nr:formate hydrogenlyase transcriptional activator FlhA [Klebsiella pneumoniae]SVS30537.1 formate hydrogenlyase transcriptional activator FhlA [Klebsiella pneumoniae]SVT19671.1 formate hydrogenlyase transcriptional activator FhlA [Klebsiella pneumoniae]
MKSVQLAHGSGGQAMQQLIGDLFMQAFANPWLAEQEDQARLDLAALAAQGDRLAFSTDSYVIDPLFFPGGNIGKLAVCGTANDVAVSGAIPRYLSCGFILEEGLEMATLEAVVASMADTARAAGIAIVTGDTKVVPRGAADKLFINTAGIGAIPADVHWGTQQISAGDVLLVSGTLGDHGATILNLREQMGLDGALSSDCAVLSRLDIDELVSEVAKEIHRYFRIDAISVVLRSDRKGKLNIYSTHYLDASHPVHDQSEVDEAGTLTERVFKSKEMLLLNLHEHDTLAPYEKMLFEMWGNKIQTLCLLPLMSGNTLLGVLKLAQCDEQVFTTTNLKLLRQIAERVSIAIDNALAYREIQRLKERLVDENLALTEQLNNVESEFGEIIGRSEAMNNVLKQVEMVAQSDSTVLILGETGTGKELIARAIHNLSGRNGRRMVKMNCAAMPAGLLESDLFGHERGAFTGASAQRIGRFELADKSSLFLDEVGDMPLELQPKLLRVLQEQEFERLGSNKLIQTDVRLIAATNRDLKQMVIDREFRSDLYYRLNVFPIHLPPLRERPDDIPLLVKAFTFKIARRMGRNIDSIPAETLRTLTRMEWPGNVRELENVIERAVLLTRGNVLQLSLPERDIVEAPRTPAVLPEEGEDEYQLIVRVLKESNGVVAGPKGAAQRLGLKRTTLLSRMKRLGINKDELV